MNIKKKDFLISNIIVVVFTILLVLVLNHFLTIQFGFNKQTFIPITISLLIFGAILYYFLSKELLEPLFRSEQKIQDLIKETLHELNTPVATIQVNTKMLQKKIDDEKNSSRLNRIEQSCDNLLSLYSQMEYNIKEQIDNVNNDPFELYTIISNSCDKFKDIKKDIAFQYDNSSISVESDINGFQRVVDNLVSNAIKYNKPNGKVIITVKSNTLSISDTGVGIDTKNLFHVFDKYYQEDSLSSGIGLGLNMVKAYCDKYKIDIKIDSKIGIGTTFNLDLKEILSSKKG
ncbi:MAG: HAMP domain-containing sensor histidine kinase [Campylobacterota bacterium]|nr:HAMP domain-containing sensor histidine kinase [Campylobacterota bacterium]